MHINLLYYYCLTNNRSRERKPTFFVIIEVTIDKFKENQGDNMSMFLDTARIEVKAGKVNWASVGQMAAMVKAHA